MMNYVNLYFQLDDKRQEAEKKLLLLNVQHEGLVNQYDLSKKQMTKLKVTDCNLYIAIDVHGHFLVCNVLDTCYKNSHCLVNINMIIALIVEWSDQNMCCYYYQ